MVRELSNSVRTELERIVSQRNYFYGLNYHLGLEDQRLPDTVLNYGLPSVVDVDTTVEAVGRVAEAIRRAIVQYEPRLLDPMVNVESTGGPLTPARISVSGKLAVDSGLVSFNARIPLAADS